MKQEPTFSATCPGCDAALSLSSAAFGIVRCAHCGQETALRSLPDIDPEIVARYEIYSRASAGSSPLGNAMRQFRVILFCAMAGAALVGAWFTFIRLSIYHAPLWPLLGGASAIAALVWKRRLFGGLIALSVGLLTALKPLVRGNEGIGLFSEANLIYLIPGLLLLALGAASLLGVKPSERKKAVALLRPTAAGAIGLVVGAGLIAALFGGTTNRAILNAEAGFLEARSAQYDAFARFIAGEAELSSVDLSAPLSPKPVFIKGDPSSNTDIVSAAELPIKPAENKSDYADLYIKSPLAEVLGSYRSNCNYDDWRFDEELASYLSLSRNARYTVAYRCDKLPDYGLDNCRMWMFDLATNRLLLERELGLGLSYGAESNLFSSLAAATGGDFR
jgi:hypothetical protein